MFGCGVSDCVVSQHAMQHGWDASGPLQCPPLLQSATTTGFLVGVFLLWRCEQCLGVVFPTAWCHSTLCSMAGTRLVRCNVLRCCKAQQPPVFLLGIFCFGGVSNVWVWCFRLRGVTARYAAWLGRVWSAALSSAVSCSKRPKYKRQCKILL
jgi:hypothetical protein